MCFIPAALYFERFSAPLLPGAQSTTTSAEASKSDSPPLHTYPPSAKAAMRSGSSLVQYRGKPLRTARSQPKLGPVLVTPATTISSCASTASATLFPIVPNPFIATLITHSAPNTLSGVTTLLNALYQHTLPAEHLNSPSKQSKSGLLPVRVKTGSTVSRMRICARLLRRV